MQELIVEMASREGIRVEIVDPRDTSNRCSRCGELGKRTSKIFICEHCGFELHADLNAARNIIVAPNSPTAIRGEGRCPLPPTK
ncbi:MAG: zinc ribbon domain-containing protein [Candidatus Helarchaeota archaeon]